MFEIELVEKGGPLLSALKAKGYSVELEEDYDKIAAKVQQVGRLETIPMMDVDRLDFEQGQAFWLFLKKGEERVASVSAKSVDLRNETLGSYTRRTSRGQYKRSFDPIHYMDPMFDVIRGMVVYTGQVQTEKKDRPTGNVQPSDLLKFLKVMQLVILARWKFDWMYGFVGESHIPLNRLYGFSCVIRRAIVWREPVPEGRENSHALLASPRRQVELLFTGVEVDKKLSEDQGSTLLSAIANSGSSS